MPDPRATPEELARVLGSPERIVRAGIGDILRHHDAFEAAPLEDYEPERYLVLRPRA